MNNEKNLNEENEQIETLDVEETEEVIEVLDDNKIKEDNSVQNFINNESISSTESEKEKIDNNEDNIIDINRLFNINEKEEKIAEQEIKNEEKKKDNKILKIQIGLIVMLFLIATLVYFFGYNLLEPFIKID